MKIVIKKYFPVIIAALGVFFAITVYFFGLQGTENGIFAEIGTVLTGASEEKIVSDIIKDDSFVSIEVPDIKYCGGTIEIGDVAGIKELFQFTYADGSIVNGKDTEYVIYLLDVEDTSGKSVMEIFTPEDIEAMEEITSPFIYDEENDLLHFHKSGSFKVLLRVYYDANTYMEYEFYIPVEVR